MIGDVDDALECLAARPVYNVPDVAIGIFTEMLKQEMKSLWYTEPEERKAMVHECFLWAKDFCDEVEKWEDEDENEV